MHLSFLLDVFHTSLRRLLRVLAMPDSSDASWARRLELPILTIVVFHLVVKALQLLWPDQRRPRFLRIRHHLLFEW